MKVGDLVQDMLFEKRGTGVVICIALDGSYIPEEQGGPDNGIFKVLWSDGSLGFYYEKELKVLNESR